MINTQRTSILNVFVLCLFALLSFSSCSDDDNDDCNPALAELSSDATGAYTGILTFNGTQVVNQSGTATITESSCKTYTISFSDDVPSITDAQFIGTSNNTVFTYVSSDATTSVAIDEEGDLALSSSGTDVIAFSGSK